MKRFLILLTALIMAFSLFACNGDGDEVIVQEGQKLAGYDAGNDAVRYSFIYPEEWSMIRNDGVIELQYDCNNSDAIAEYATMTVLVFTLSDSSQTAADYWEDHKAEVESVFAEYKELDKEETELDATPALKVKYSANMNGRTYVSDQIICCRYGEVFLVTLVAPEEYYDTVKDALGTAKENFKFE